MVLAMSAESVDAVQQMDDDETGQPIVYELDESLHAKGRHYLSES